MTLDQHIAEIIPGKDLPKPQSYERYEFEAIKLKNGMDVMLMSSPDVDMASCCIGVGVGSLNETSEYQGLAHFCEHMLFMGNDKYPDEAEYCQYIANGGGVRNARTYESKTIYFASIKPEMLDGLVDRLSHFFLTPHFDADGVNREVEAVNSEFELWSTSDEMRCYMLKKRLANPEHPFFLFSVGNNKYLRRLDVNPDPAVALTKLREALLAFHAKYYSSHLMFAFVSGNQPLAELREMTVPRFAQLVRNDVEILRGSKRCGQLAPWKAAPTHQRIRCVPIAEEKRHVEFQFTLPDQYDVWRSKPSVVFSHVIGHEGPGSVLSFLKRAGLATSLRAGCDERDTGFSLECVGVDFTEQSLTDANIVKAGEAIFAMTRLLVESGVPDWLVDEVVQLQRLQFKFEELPSTARMSNEMGRKIHEYGLRDAFGGDALIYEVDREAILDVLRRIRPDNAQMFLTARAYEAECTSEEPIYGIKYKEDEVPTEWMQAWEHIMKCDAATFDKYCNQTGLKLLAPNQYIPQDLDIKAGGMSLDQLPSKLDSLPGNFYFKQDGHFKLPLVTFKTLWTLPFTRPTWDEMNAYLDGAKPVGAPAFDGVQWYHRVILAYFLVEMVEESLKEEMYDAEMVDTRWAGNCKDPLLPYNNGIGLSVRGYNDKAHLLVQKYVDKFIKFDMAGNELPVVYAMLQRYFATKVQTQDPYATAAARVNEALGVSEWSDSELQAILKDLKQSDLDKHLQSEKLPEWVHAGGVMRGMIFGNIDKHTAEEMYVKPLQKLTQAQKPSSFEDVVPGWIVNLTKSKDLLLVATTAEKEFVRMNTESVFPGCPTCMVYNGKTTNVDSPDNACILTVQFAKAGRDTEMTLLLLDNWLSTKFFNDLRTAQALGYVVTTSASLDNRQPHYKFVVQSTKPSLFVLSRIEAFVKEYLFGDSDDFANSFKLKCTEEEFGTMKSAVISTLKARPKSMAEQQSRYCTAVLNETFDFERRQKGIEFIEGLSFETFSGALRDAFMNSVWLATCLDAPKAEHAEPQKSQILAASKSVNYYRMKDNKSIIRTCWKSGTETRKSFFTSYPCTA
eukprot:Gregarina_sp_Pseudo_9__1870@NODE_227_length_3510_cov_29_214636_g211_i0_p1_GENE_NODE_227_length_3510_cov_29_214636_g211_i0NODE_227_length_3510_cov_29_214636_g211_i0_p1_ORF_typecomplete_len1070_score359_14Peptidase_M16_M/PF16187_5/7_3e45Peptidase_M16_M/PF16187_5/1_6e02Peptidase_M16/PF00675_20/6_9e30Peptidase_M16/PF00675_20/7_2e03Peptidase_M16_C/PF05193_21/5_6e12Peptidase_M16_C/PF05193_21/0_014GIDA_assoc/PF13932_6/0_095_NODE_227_length_3510_cov_29_214636_g211_i01093318